MVRLSKNFTRAEFEKSIFAIRNGIDNAMDTEHLENAITLCDHVLQPARDFNGAILITSGYRNPVVNAGVNGSRTSDHMTGRAADIELIHGSNWQLLKWIAKYCEYDQLIAEHMVEGDPDAGWVHVSYRDGQNRNQLFGWNREGSYPIDKAELLT